MVPLLIVIRYVFPCFGKYLILQAIQCLYPHFGRMSSYREYIYCINKMQCVKVTLPTLAVQLNHAVIENIHRKLRHLERRPNSVEKLYMTALTSRWHYLVLIACSVKYLMCLTTYIIQVSAMSVSLHTMAAHCLTTIWCSYTSLTGWIFVVAINIMLSFKEEWKTMFLNEFTGRGNCVWICLCCEMQNKRNYIYDR